MVFRGHFVCSTVGLTPSKDRLGWPRFLVHQLVRIYCYVRSGPCHCSALRRWSPSFPSVVQMFVQGVYLLFPAGGKPFRAREDEARSGQVQTPDIPSCQLARLPNRTLVIKESQPRSGWSNSQRYHDMKLSVTSFRRRYDRANPDLVWRLIRVAVSASE